MSNVVTVILQTFHKHRSANANFPSLGINQQITKLNLAIATGFLLAPAQDRPHSCHQLPRIEGFGQVIIRA